MPPSTVSAIGRPLIIYLSQDAPHLRQNRRGLAGSLGGTGLARKVNRVAHAQSARVPRSHPEEDGLMVRPCVPAPWPWWRALLCETPSRYLTFDPADGTTEPTRGGEAGFSGDRLYLGSG